VRLARDPVLLLFLLIGPLLFGTACASATYDIHDDLTVSTQVKIALIDDPRLGEFRINATTVHGVVTLEGSVPSAADAKQAIAIARKVRGVRDVKSELKFGSDEVASVQLPASNVQFSVPASSLQLQFRASSFQFPASGVQLRACVLGSGSER